MKSIIIFSLFILSLSNTKVTIPEKISDIFYGVKQKIYECVSTSSEASETLKQYAKKQLEENSHLSFNFNSIELTQEDREVIRKCKRDSFRTNTRRPDTKVTPISLENAVFKLKKVERKKDNIPIRKLGMLDEVKRLGAFNIKGIFTCLEDAQPAIKVFRNTVYLWKSKDFTGAIINVYDNFQTLADGLTTCINAIFPA